MKTFIRQSDKENQKSSTVNSMSHLFINWKFFFLLFIPFMLTVTSCTKDDVDEMTEDVTNIDPQNTDQYLSLNKAMRDLWAEHMQWTYATVDAFFNNQGALQSNLDRLLLNQKHIGDAIKPYYGEAAGDTLTKLLKTHILDAVPVLTAAQEGDDAALTAAIDIWYANAKTIADFLSAANPENWPETATEPIMEKHITTTVTYSVDLLKGDYKKAIDDYGLAYDHMMMLADVLTKGIAEQFPQKF